MKNIYFNYGGIYAFYMYVGAIRVLYKNKAQIDMKNLRVYGCSAGAAFAFIFLLVLNDIVTVDQVEHELDQVFTNANEFMFDIAPYGIKLLEGCFLQYIGNREILRIVNKHLFIGISFEHCFRFIHKFHSNYELCDVLMISCSAPFMSSYVNVYRGATCLDGGVQFKLYCLPRGTFVVYNATEFPEACTIPDKDAKSALIANGILFVEKYLRNDRASYKADLYKNEHTFTDETVKNIFFIHKYIIRKNPRWNNEINRFVCQCQNGISSGSVG